MTYADFIVKMAEINRVLDAPEIHTPEELARCQLLVIECEAFEKVAFPIEEPTPEQRVAFRACQEERCGGACEFCSNI